MLDEVLARGHPDPPDRAADGTIGGRGGRQGLHTEHLATCSPRCRAWPASTRAHMVTACAEPRPGGRPRRAWRAVVDPEMPMLTLDDLGVVRGGRGDGDAVTVTITPTYSGCPAHGGDARRPARRARPRRATRASRCAPCSRRRGPPTGSPRRQAQARRGTASPRPAAAPRGTGPDPADPDRARGRRALPALRLAGHRGALPVRPHRLHGAAPLPAVPGAVRAHEGDLRCQPDAHRGARQRARRLPPAAGGRRRAALRRRRRRHLRRARRAARGLRVPARPVPDAAPARRRAGGAPVLLDLRAGRGAAADRGAPGGHRAVLRVAGRPAASPATRSRWRRRPARSPRTSTRAPTTAWSRPARGSPRCCPSRPACSPPRRTPGSRCSTATGAPTR